MTRASSLSLSSAFESRPDRTSRCADDACNWFRAMRLSAAGDDYRPLAWRPRYVRRAGAGRCVAYRDLNALFKRLTAKFQGKQFEPVGVGIPEEPRVLRSQVVEFRANPVDSWIFDDEHSSGACGGAQPCMATLPQTHSCGQW